VASLSKAEEEPARRLVVEQVVFEVVQGMLV
jgi:hypothetical protein